MLRNTCATSRSSSYGKAEDSSDDSKRQWVIIPSPKEPFKSTRYSATDASRNGAPLEVVSKVILRHQDLKTTQVYLGKISASEAIRGMDILHGK
jgi:hypothetical protein